MLTNYDSEMDSWLIDNKIYISALKFNKLEQEIADLKEHVKHLIEPNILFKSKLWTGLVILKFPVMVVDLEMKRAKGDGTLPYGIVFDKDLCCKVYEEYIQEQVNGKRL